MILDRLSHADAYAHLGPGIAAALQFLQETDISRLKDGRHELSDGLYAMVQRYTTKQPDPLVWESHRRHLDVQYIAEGVERMGWTPRTDALEVTRPYDNDGDAMLYRASGSMIDVAAGQFIMFGPWDVHAPGLAAGDPPTPRPVVKVVVKVPMNTVTLRP